MGRSLGPNLDVLLTAATAFLLKASAETPNQGSTFYYTQHGSEAKPAYALRYPDPEHRDAKNRYAAALYDAHNPEVVFAEVLLLPNWTQPSLSAEAIRLNGGVAPPPTPILPGEFVVQLYNPDQQIKVKHKPGSWGSAPSWEFEMPKQTFRQPSTSSIDRTQSDPAASEITPRIGFKWKKDSKFTKDLACFLSGRVAGIEDSRRKNKEPDITVAIFHSLKAMTMYEPNLNRVEIEDTKGFEVVLLLGAVVIRDVYFGQIDQAFRISGQVGVRRTSASSNTPAAVPRLGDAKPVSPPGALQTISSPGRHAAPVSPPHPHREWGIEAETARLRRQAGGEEDRKRKEAADHKERLRRQAQVDQETERLKQIYGTQWHPALQVQTRPGPGVYHQPHPRLHTTGPSHFPRPLNIHPPGPQHIAWGQPAQGSYLQAPGGHPSQSGISSHAGARPQQKLKEKRSFFGFRREDNAGKLHKKRSSMF